MSASTVVSYVAIGTLSIVMVIVAVTLADRFGPTAVVVCAMLALVPLTICVGLLLWVDRWEPEPFISKLLAVLWGAAASIGLTLLLAPQVTYLLESALTSLSSHVVSAVFEAPVLEETCKCAGVMVIFLLRRREFHGPIDGIVYGGLIGAGFAFTENILYFGRELVTAGTVGGMTEIFVLRGLLSPLAHVMFTGVFGLIVGAAAMRKRTRTVITIAVPALIPSIAGHMLWNGSPILAGDFLVGYLLLQVPLFGVAIVTVVLLRRREARRLRRCLGEYAAAGWFTREEVWMLATARGRRRSLLWASARGVRPQMKRFIRLSAHLAQARQRIHTRYRLEEHQERERQMLAETARIRGQLQAMAVRPRH